MPDHTTPAERFTPNATLAAIGLKLQSLKLLDPIRDGVRIKQKTIDDSPFDKLTDLFVTMLSGAHTISQVNTILRADPALQRAFGRERCAEQSVVQDTLDAASRENVCQMQQAVDVIFRAHSRTSHHDFESQFLIVDGDLTGLPSGPTAENAPVGYLSGEGIRHGRQLGRMVASQYGEVVVDRLYPGNTVMPSALRPLVEAFEQTLLLTPEQRERTILRFDAAAGSLDDVNWMLARGYQLHGKDYSSVRARALSTTVRQWYADPKREGREVGLVEADSLDYARQLRRIAVRWRKKNGQWEICVLHSTLTSEQILALMGEEAEAVDDWGRVLQAYARFYDLRGGGVETQVKQDKQTGMRTRQKKRFEAQAIVQQVTALAHNVVLWSQQWLVEQVEEEVRRRVKKLGVKRMMRDVLRVSGKLRISASGKIERIVLNAWDPLGRLLQRAFARMLACEHVVVILGQL